MLPIALDKVLQRLKSFFSLGILNRYFAVQHCVIANRFQICGDGFVVGSVILPFPRNQFYLFSGCCNDAVTIQLAFEHPIFIVKNSIGGWLGQHRAVRKSFRFFRGCCRFLHFSFFRI